MLFTWLLQSCKDLMGCGVGFYTHVLNFGLFGKSLEVVDCSADSWKFWARLNLFGSLDHLLSSCIFLNWDPRTSGIRCAKDSRSVAHAKAS